MAVKKQFEYSYDFSPRIEVVDAVKNNIYDHSKVSFMAKGDSRTIIKWCRRNFGERGDGWDFTAGTRGVEVTIWSSKLLMMWKLWQE
jgi:hypothetical protein